VATKQAYYRTSAWTFSGLTAQLAPLRAALTPIEHFGTFAHNNNLRHARHTTRRLHFLKKFMRFPYRARSRRA